MEWVSLRSLWSVSLLAEIGAGWNIVWRRLSTRIKWPKITTSSRTSCSWHLAEEASWGSTSGIRYLQNWPDISGISLLNSGFYAPRCVWTCSGGCDHGLGFSEIFLRDSTSNNLLSAAFYVELFLQHCPSKHSLWERQQVCNATGGHCNMVQRCPKHFDPWILFVII